MHDLKCADCDALKIRRTSAYSRDRLRQHGCNWDSLPIAAKRGYVELVEWASEHGSHLNYSLLAESDADSEWTADHLVNGTIPWNIR